MRTETSSSRRWWKQRHDPGSPLSHEQRRSRIARDFPVPLIQQPAPIVRHPDAPSRLLPGPNCGIVRAMFRRLAPLLAAISVLAHDGLELPLPNSEGDAWNAIQLCLINVDKLVAEQLWSEVPVQGALINRGARFLKEKSTDAGQRALWQEVENTGVSLVRAAPRREALPRADRRARIALRCERRARRDLCVPDVPRHP